jgi:hypothetical protein
MTVNQPVDWLLANYQNAETIYMSYDILRRNTETVLQVSAVLAFRHFTVG